MHPGDDPSPSQTPLPSALYHLEKFEGNGLIPFDKFIRDFELVYDVKALDDSRRRILLDNHLRGAAREFALQASQIKLGYNELKENLEQRFSRRAPKREARKKFFSCKQGPGERVKEYANRVRSLASEAESDGLRIDITEVADIFLTGLCPNLWQRAHQLQNESWEVIVSSLHQIEERDDEYSRCQLEDEEGSARKLRELSSQMARLESKLKNLETENQDLRRTHREQPRMNMGNRWNNNQARGFQRRGGSAQNNQPTIQGARQERPQQNPNGSEANIVNIDSLDISAEGLGKPTFLKGISGSELRSLGSGLGFDGILGMPGFKALRLTLNHDGSVRSDFEQDEEPTKLAFLSSLQASEVPVRPPSIPLHRIRTGEDVLRAYSHCFCDDISDMGDGSTIIAPKLKMTGKPVYRRQYPIPNKLVSKVKALVDELEEAGIIEESTSLWNSPLFPVAKTDGSVCITMDLRLINEICIPEGDRDYFTFSLPYRFTRLPQGAKNSAQIFQWAMNLVLGDLLYKCVRLYIDDVIVYSDSHEQHVADLAAVLERLSRFNLKARRGKSYLFRDSVDYLGHVIDQYGIKPMWDNVAALRDLKRPHNIRGVRSLLGTVNYYRRFIPNAGELLAPLSNLLKKGRRFTWGTIEQTAFETIKQVLTSEPLLAHPMIGRPFILNTDASGIAVGACIQQEIDGWAEIIQDLNVTFVYVPGKENTVADFLSRFLCEDDPESSRDKRVVAAVIKNRGPPLIDSDRTWEGLLKDKKWAPLLKLIGDRWSTETVTYKNKDYKMHEGYLVSKNSGGIWVKVVPSHIREMVIKYHHDVPTGGHFGVKKVMRRLKDDYYWTGMRTQVRNYIYRCEGCQLSNQGVTKAGNAPHFRPGKPFEHLALDFIGPLEKTSRGHSSILTIVDLFTKFPILIPTRDQCASTVVKALLESVITIFGIPKTILSDRGSAFISCIFKGICKAMRVSAVNTTAWRPQSNGAVERLNRTVIESLRRCEAGSNWDDILPMVALAIRTTEHSSTGFTPAKLVFGHELRLPQPFQEAGQSPVREDLIAQTAAFYERELTEEVEKIREVVRQIYLSEQEEARIKFENKRLRTFNNGDLVLVERMHETKGRHKFEPSFDVQDLWKLDVLGIMDAAETKSRKDLIEASNTHFKETVKRDESGRYIVSLPWIAGHPPVPVNRRTTENRLLTTTRNVQGKMLYEKYDTIFEEWEKERFIEEVEDKWEECSYLPHRPVLKDSHTTPIRPVFDASCKKKGLPSLNQCLEKGDNLIELIPDLLLRFRLGKYGIIADMRKAFLQIQVREEDREFLRFLWWKKDQKTLKFYRHCRVVFGLTSSPFLLAATIKYHLSLPQFQYNRCAELLARSFYVDNCILSLSSTHDVKKFIKESSDIMMQAKFELRDWMWNEPGITEQDPASILGMKWHLQTDTIAINVQSFKNIDEEKSITKRSILSACHRIFDPIQFTCPATIKIKKMVQDAWKENKSWDEQLNEDRLVEFIKWRKQALELDQIKIPRWILPIKGRTTLHVFCDASAIAYATVIFMRIENASVIVVRFFEARNRLATIKRITIPRLELLACLIGAQLLVHVLENLEESPEKIQCWTDSSPALYWIQQQENWAQFVSNRVKEITTLTKSEDWNHVAGEHNPADLPSRGESPSKFTKSGWWEGPKWLQEKKEDWPVSKVQYDLEAIEEERRKTVVAGFVAKKPEENPWYLNLYEGKREVTLTQILRVIAWMLRFKPSEYKGDIISQEELDSAEKSLVKIIQSESIGEEDPKMKQLHAFQDKEGLWRVKTRIVNRNDDELFRLPILIPTNHPVTELIVKSVHEKMYHCGAQTLRSVLREKFWIPKARQLVRHVIHKCPRCRRFETKRVDVPEASLPQHRVRDVVVFEVTGIDLGGPLYLEDGQKVWFVIFTCGVYRAVHLELVTSLSTEALVGAVERFVARRGCPAVIYSDNGTNLVGLRNELYRVNFGVKWKLNPPAAPWWGGWIERIVGLTKTLLRRLLGKRVVNYEEMVTILENCERVINARPLTYIAEDNDDLVPLTPEMFLREPRTEGEIGLNEFRCNFGKSYEKRKRLLKEFRKRFRSEYLGLLVHQDNRKKQRQLKVRDIVLVEVENRKQINWPMGKITKVFPGTDNVRRLVEVKTKSGFMKRAVQRLFPLEVPSEDVEQGDGELKPAEDEIVREKTPGVESVSVQEKTTPVKVGKVYTRSGRKVKLPIRFK
ncbi:hypothetical protein LAZ67_21002318 [Cordylochernes scorpioides]|uniref:Integrase catalytic domain-containing protein n=1 Tax=Cordylochernes scorpioides TaxID=51811 RepID=A0ABY6LRL0_9ARAC|nr:hypothetical protein LAZ67_21002318 [Cordylochernes scorpioides]